MNKLVVLAALSLISSAEAAKWDKANNPYYFNALVETKFTAAFSDLPLSAKLKNEHFAWSETYWPSRYGGIAYRWNSPDPQPFKYKLNSKAELLSMSEAQLSELSPAELYDIASNDYSYSLTKKVLKSYSPKDLWWEGICHGWSLAASNYAEPAKVVITNKDGIKVPFGSSDVKGLLAMHDAYNTKGFNVRVGNRCKAIGKVAGEGVVGKDPVLTPPPKKEAENDECMDVNAGSFHIIITNMIGINSQGFVAEVDRFNDIWNQPVSSYDAHIVGDVALTPIDYKNGVDRKLRINLSMTYAEELVFEIPEYIKKGYTSFVSKEPVTGTDKQNFSTRHYDYVLELDKMGNIIGGEWISESRPDFLWLRGKDKEFRNGKFPLANLNKIYKPVED